MSIADTPRVAGPFATNGATTGFPFEFKVLAATDVVVEIDGVVVTTGYTVELNADQDDNPGGSVTISPALDGPVVVLTSNTALTQPAEFANNGAFYPRVLNDSLDRLTIVAQEQARDVERGLKLPLGETGGASLLPGVEDRAGKFLAFDVDGVPYATSTAPVATSDVASQEEAEEGENNIKIMTPLRVKQAILFRTSALSTSLSTVITKLAGVEDGATANQDDNYLLDRANHSGTQSSSTIQVTERTILGRYALTGGPAQNITVGAGLSLSDSGVLTATGSGGGTADWGDITGTLSDQTDLQTALDGKQDAVAIGSGKLLGRASAGPGAPEELSVGSGLAIAGGALVATGGGAANYAKPEDYGALAVEDGGTAANNTPFMKLAFESGKIIDGGGKTYMLATQVAPTTGFRGFVRCGFVWRDSTAMGLQTYMVSILGFNNFIIEENVFDIGTREDTGSYDDSNRGALRVTTSNPNVTFNNRVSVKNNRVFGSGNGTAIYVRSCYFVDVIGNTVHDRNVTVPSGHSNDCQNGIDVSQCRQAKVHGNTVMQLRSRETSGGSLEYKWSRGILGAELSNFSFIGNTVYGCDQNFDFSGAISTTNPGGNVGGTITGNVSAYCRTWAYKLANCARDIVFTGNIGREFGHAGLTMSGQSSAWPAGTSGQATRNVLVKGNMFLDPSNLQPGRDDCVGIWVNPKYLGYAGYPEGVRIIDNVIEDRTGAGKLKWGVIVADEDRLVVADAQYIEVRGNRVRGNTGPSTLGCYPHGICSVSGTGSQSIPNDTATDLNWNLEIVDGEAMHSNSSNPSRITAVREGWHKVTASVVLSGNVTGYRTGRVLRNGGTFPGCEMSATPISSADTLLNGACLVYLTVGQHLRVEVRQTSGGALNAQLLRSAFTVERVDMA